MPLRLVEVHASAGRADAIEEVLTEASLVDHWRCPAGDDGVIHHLLVRSEAVEGVTDSLADIMNDDSSFRVVVLPIEATLPRPEEEEADAEEVSEETGEAEKKAGSGRVSREELLQEMEGATRLSGVYIATVVLSTVVASVGLLRDDVAVIIGAMVIAPLLGPNVALSLAATLGDGELGRKALRTAAAGGLTVLTLSVLMGLLLTVDPTIPQLMTRTRVGLPDVGLALAAGSAGALAFTTGLSTAVIGVMVAVALLPPMVATGLLAGAGLEREALAAATLTATNIACVNLAGVATFLAQRVSPRTWWEAERAKKTIRIAMAVWLGLLAALVLLIVFAWNG